MEKTKSMRLDVCPVCERKPRASGRQVAAGIAVLLVLAAGLGGIIVGVAAGLKAVL